MFPSLTVILCEAWKGETIALDFPINTNSINLLLVKETGICIAIKYSKVLLTKKGLIDNVNAL